AKAAAEREAGDPGRRVDAERGREAERLRFPVEVRQCCAWLDAGGAGGRIDADRLHQREIDEQAAVAHRVAGNVVAAGAHGYEEIMLPRQLDRLNDVARAQTTRYDC